MWQLKMVDFECSCYLSVDETHYYSSAQQKQKELEYKEKLDEMKDKLKDRPYLFERISMVKT